MAITPLNSMTPAAGTDLLQGIHKPKSKEFGALLELASGKVGEQLQAKASPEAELEKYVQMTPAQRMRESILEKLGLKEEDVAAMKPEERKGIEDQIAAEVRRLMEASGEKKGSSIDVSV